MKKFILLAVSIFVLAGTSLHCEQNKELAVQLADVLGFEEMLEETRNQTNASAEKQMNQMLEQFKNAFAGMPPETMNKVMNLAQEYTRKVSNSWDAAEASRIYSEALSRALPEEELRESIEYYSTPEGKNQLRAISAAGAEVNAYIQTSMQKASIAQTQEFIAQMQILIQEELRSRESGRSISGKPQQ